MLPHILHTLCKPFSTGEHDDWIVKTCVNPKVYSTMVKMLLPFSAVQPPVISTFILELFKLTVFKYFVICEVIH